MADAPVGGQPVVDPSPAADSGHVGGKAKPAGVKRGWSALEPGPDERPLKETRRAGHEE